MKRMLLLVLLLAPCSLLHSQNEKEKVWQLIVRLDNLLVAKDSADLSALLTDDFRGTITTGEYFSKSAYISHHCVRNSGLVALTGEDINAAIIRIYGNSAIVNRRIHARSKLPDGSISEFDIQKMEICIRQNGNWLIAGGQATKVSPPMNPLK